MGDELMVEAAGMRMGNEVILGTNAECVRMMMRLVRSVVH